MLLSCTTGEQSGSVPYQRNFAESTFHALGEIEATGRGGPGETNEQLGKGEGAAQKVDPPHHYHSESR
jgi:hypothetical protein